MNNTLAGLSPKRLGKKLLSDYSYWLSFVLLVIVATAINPKFLQWDNLSLLFVQASITGIIALGMTMVICSGQIDISVGAQVAIISGFGIWVLNATGSPLLMLGFCMVFGGIIGLINGLLVAKGKMPAMIATLATQSICRSLVNHFGAGFPFSVSKENNAFRLIGAGSIEITPGFKIPYLMIIFILLGLIFGVIMQRTKLGKHVYAVGSNATSARLAGVRVDRIKIAVFAITGLLCGLVGWLYASRMMSIAAANAGNLFEMDAIGAVAIGGTAMSGGRGKIIGTFLGALMFKIINMILVMANFPTFLNGAISGAILILAVLLQNLNSGKK